MMSPMRNIQYPNAVPTCGRGGVLRSPAVCFGKLALLFAHELILYTLLSSSSMHSIEVVCIICILLVRRSYLVVCILE
jgi:hypothetical protein